VSDTEFAGPSVLLSLLLCVFCVSKEAVMFAISDFHIDMSKVVATQDRRIL